MIAVASSVATIALSTAASREELMNGVLVAMSQGASVRGWLWAAAIATFMGGLLARILSRVRQRSDEAWHAGFALDGISTSLIAISGGLGCAALTIGLAIERSLWALPLAAVVLYWCYRWIATSRYRVGRTAGL